MPRPPRAQLVPLEAVDLAPVAGAEPSSLLARLEDLIRVSNSDELRLRLMSAIDFPSADIPTFLAVNQLSLHGALRPTDLAERLETGRPNTTKIVQRLEALGLVARCAAPEDGRAVLVALTPAGREVAARLTAAQRASIDAATQGWTTPEREAFGELVARFVAGARQGPAG